MYDFIINYYSRIHLINCQYLTDKMQEDEKWTEKSADKAQWKIITPKAVKLYKDSTSPPHPFMKGTTRNNDNIHDIYVT